MKQCVPTADRESPANTPIISFQAPLKRAGKDRPRSTRTGKHYTTAKTVRAERNLKQEAALAMHKAGLKDPVTGPVGISIEMVSARPKRPSNPYPSKPDIDNSIKLIFDALNKVAWGDDVQVVNVTATKRFGPEDMIRVQIERIDLT